jgi:chemotaxis protein CheD
MWFGATVDYFFPTCKKTLHYVLYISMNKNGTPDTAHGLHRLNLRVVGIGDMIVSNRPDDLIVTFALGSCLGLAVYDPVAGVGGILHAMLPDSSIHRKEEEFIPSRYVNTGIPMLFKEAYKLGAEKGRIIVKMAGCSTALDDGNVFDIGQRNYTAAQNTLRKNNVPIDAEHCGSSKSITLMLEIKTGNVIMRIRNKEIPL